MTNRRGKHIFIYLFLLAAMAWPQDDGELKLVAGERFAVREGITGICEFTKPPQIGMVILKIQLFDKTGQKISPLAIRGSYGMPSMPGHHDSGDVAFQLNKKQNYLLPIQVVMPGDWEVKIVFLDGEQVALKAAFRFDV